MRNIGIAKPVEMAGRPKPNQGPSHMPRPGEILPPMSPPNPNAPEHPPVSFDRPINDPYTEEQYNTPSEGTEDMGPAPWDLSNKKDKWERGHDSYDKRRKQWEERKKQRKQDKYGYDIEMSDDYSPMNDYDSPEMFPPHVNGDDLDAWDNYEFGATDKAKAIRDLVKEKGIPVVKKDGTLGNIDEMSDVTLNKMKLGQNSQSDRVKIHEQMDKIWKDEKDRASKINPYPVDHEDLPINDSAEMLDQVGEELKKLWRRVVEIAIERGDPVPDWVNPDYDKTTPPKADMKKGRIRSPRIREIVREYDPSEWEELPRRKPKKNKMSFDDPKPYMPQLPDDNPERDREDDNWWDDGVRWQANQKQSYRDNKGKMRRVPSHGKTPKKGGKKSAEYNGLFNPENIRAYQEV